MSTRMQELWRVAGWLAGLDALLSLCPSYVPHVPGVIVYSWPTGERVVEFVGAPRMADPAERA